MYLFPPPVQSFALLSALRWFIFLALTLGLLASLGHGRVPSMGEVVEGAELVGTLVGIWAAVRGRE